MKKLFSLGLALAAPVALSAADFEGKVAMRMTSPGDAPQTMNFSIAKNFSRIDVQPAPGRSAAIIFDPARQEMTVLMPEQKMYMVQSLAKPMESAANAVAGRDGSVEQSSEHEKILGYDCTKWISKSNGTTAEIWLTDQIGTFMGLGAGANPMGGFGGGGRSRGGPPPGAGAQPWEAALKGKDFFPLRVVSKNGEGRETFRMEATAIEKQPLPASLFKAPADYQDLSSMMRGMGLPGGLPFGK